MNFDIIFGDSAHTFFNQSHQVIVSRTCNIEHSWNSHTILIGENKLWADSLDTCIAIGLNRLTMPMMNAAALDNVFNLKKIFVYTVFVFVQIPVAAQLVLRKFRGISWRHQLQQCDATSHFHSIPKVFSLGWQNIHKFVFSFFVVKFWNDIMNKVGQQSTMQQNVALMWNLLIICFGGNTPQIQQLARDLFNHTRSIEFAEY